MVKINCNARLNVHTKARRLCTKYHFVGNSLKHHHATRQRQATHRLRRRMEQKTANIQDCTQKANRVSALLNPMRMIVSRKGILPTYVFYLTFSMPATQVQIFQTAISQHTRSVSEILTAGTSLKLLSTSTSRNRATNRTPNTCHTITELHSEQV